MNAKQKLMTTVLVSGIVGGSILGVTLSGGAALAAGRASASARSAIEVGPTTCIGLTSLVTSGTITQSQASAVGAAMLNYMDSATGQGTSTGSTLGHGHIRTVLAPLVASGTITESQLTAIVQAMGARGMMGGGYDYSMMGGTSANANGYSMMGGTSANGYGMMGR